MGIPSRFLTLNKMGFYYNQPQGFYYNQQPKQGFYYNQQPKGFYYNQQQQQPGFYYNQQQQGFYYNQQQQQQGFYYDQQDADHSKFNKENKDYWYKGAGRERAVKALNGLRTMVDSHVTKNPHPANETQGQALSNVITVAVVQEVIKKFIRNVDPEAFFKNGGTDKTLATLLIKECQTCLGAEKDFRAAWRKEGSDAQKVMDKVSNELVPFMVVWSSKQPFSKPNAVQDAACMKVVAGRLVEEALFEYCSKNDPKDVAKNPDKQKKQVTFIAKSIADAVLHRVEEDQKALKN